MSRAWSIWVVDLPKVSGWSRGCRGSYGKAPQGLNLSLAGTAAAGWRRSMRSCCRRPTSSYICSGSVSFLGRMQHLPPTGLVQVYSGLLDVVEGDPNLLAAVLAHGESESELRLPDRPLGCVVMLIHHPAEIIHVTERHIVEGLGFLALSGVAFDVLRGASFLLTLSFPIVGDALAGQSPRPLATLL